MAGASETKKPVTANYLGNCSSSEESSEESEEEKKFETIYKENE